MVAHLSAGMIDGYCVGDPWNTNAVLRGFGRILITSSQIWNGRPEKVLGVTKRWAEEHPNTHRALLRALIESAKWLGDMANRPRAASIIATPAYTNAALDHVLPSLTGQVKMAESEPAQFLPDFNVFYRNAATFPWRSQALWFVAQMKRWRQIDDLAAAKIAARDVFQPDLYRAAAGELGIPAPMINEKIEGVHDTSWTLRDATRRITMGPDRFFDGQIFDPSDVEGYLARLSGSADSQRVAMKGD
jgi:nitrate/nitrite transport system substrate-binding protein